MCAPVCVSHITEECIYPYRVPAVPQCGAGSVPLGLFHGVYLMSTEVPTLVCTGMLVPPLVCLHHPLHERRLLEFPYLL